MLSYDRAKSIAISNTIPNGIVYYAGEVETFYIFIIAPKNFPVNIKDAMFGKVLTAVDKSDGEVWECLITDPRLKGVKKIE